MCVCVWILDCDPLNVCVCVCVWKNVWWSYHCKEYAEFLAEKKNLSVFGFWPAIVKKIMRFKKFCSTAWGTVTRIEPGDDCKKNFTCIGRRHLIDVFQKKKEQFLWDVNRMVEQSKLCCLTMAKLLLYGRWPNRLILKGGLDAPLLNSVFLLIGAPAAL